MSAPNHPDVASWRTATAADIDGMHAVHVAADPVDHPSWTTPREDIADTFELSHIDHARDTILALGHDGTVLAYGSAFLHPERDAQLRVDVSGAVRPEFRRRGIGAQIFAWQLERAHEQLAEARAADAALGQRPVELTTYAEEGDLGLVALAEASGFATERWFSTMEREMASSAPDLSAPEGLEVVAYTADRAGATLAARNDAFRDHWGSLPTSPERWEKFVGGPFLRPDLSRLVLDGDRVVALCLASVNEDDWEALGASHAYIDLIGVVRDHRRRGLAPLVVSHSLAAIAAAGLERAVLDVDTASPTGANTLYEGLGFHATERSRALVRREASPS